jgi:hypothetical protein
MRGRSRCQCIFTALLAAVAPAPAVAAQGIPGRAALQLFRDSLQLSRDTVPMHQLEARTIEQARTHRDDPLLHLRLGFVALRINELGGSAARVDDAVSEFEWAAELQPQWPYPWFGLGLAEARAPDRAAGFAGGLWTMLGIDRDTRAGSAFGRAIKADPSFVEGLIAFAQSARTQRINAPVAAALDAIRLAQASPLAWDPLLLLERGRLERLVGNPDSARLAFKRALLLGMHPGMAWVELARTLPLTFDTLPAAGGDPLPVEIAYYAGAAVNDADVVAMYRRDLEPIADDTTLTAFDALSGDARVQWLRNYWRQLAAPDMRTAGARLSEHFRRWAVAARNFRLPPFHRSYRWGIEIYQSHDTDLDDRGIVWLRQGDPTVRIVWPRGQPRARVSVAPTPQLSVSQRAAPIPGSLIINPVVGETPSYGNETWRYARPDGDVVLHFAAQEDPEDYRLVESILELDVGFDAMADRAGELPGLAQLLRAGPVGRVGMAAEDRLRGKRNISLATQTTAWPRSYAITMGGRAQWLVAGTRGEKPLVHIVYGVDAAMLRRLPVDRRTGLVPLHVRAVFLDATGTAVAALDTVESLRPPTTDDGLVMTRAEVPVTPGAVRMRLDVEANRRIGALYPLDSLRVPDPHGNALALSSVVIGVPGRSLPWEAAAADTVWLSPQSSYTAADTLALFVEGYGLRPGVRYTVHFGLTRQRSALVRLLKGHRESVALSEQLTFPAATGAIRRAISLQGLEPGNYQLQVTVDGAGGEVVRRRTLVVHAP